jgi:hypothetical protein
MAEIAVAETVAEIIAVAETMTEIAIGQLGIRGATSIVSKGASLLGILPRSAARPTTAISVIAALLIGVD